MGNETKCGYYEHYDFRRFLVIMCASAVACLGVGFNAILLWIFTVRKKQNLYLAVLSVLDTALCIFYVMLFGVDAISVYLDIGAAFYTWHAYIIPLFIISRTVQLTLPYILIFATLERMVWLSGTHSSVLRVLSSDGARPWISAAVVFCCTLLKSPMIVCYRIKEFPNCTELHGSIEVYPTEFFYSRFYYLYDFYFIAVIQIFVPFVALFILNGIIVRKLWMTNKSHGGDRKSGMLMYAEKQGKSKTALLLLGSSAGVVRRKIDNQVKLATKKMRNAIYTMTVICITYLSCNSLHVILTILEKLRSPILEDDEDQERSSGLYIVLADMVSFLFMFCSVIRLLVYYKCNDEIRNEIKTLCCCCSRSKSPNAISDDNNGVVEML